jgi:7-carboxy-7-deazaguanine synthase
MPVCEMFASLQGEGIWLGVPSAFVRFAGCNLACTWCDTPYASREPLEYEDTSMEDILAFATSDAEVRHVVLTGGEPMLQPLLPELTRQLKARGLTITIETNGTLPPGDVVCDLGSLSPKLPNSGHGLDCVSPCQPETARAWLDHSDCQFKFVIQTRGNIAAVHAFLEALGRDVSPERIFLMPEGRHPGQIAERTATLVELCRETGFRYGRRLQLDLFGDTRGT